ncbi:MAG: hypothetical protein COX43_02745 [Parcubacteria group bacterium CG23_combo_of_CG06-09_8_20_14_all_35_9]|nr:MAG: hypothetical protein COX43_02745 [Parcubacteria group bacterium CG23_combo_of_CG06-09_8_20_14_all_35_9]
MGLDKSFKRKNYDFSGFQIGAPFSRALSPFGAALFIKRAGSYQASVYRSPAPSSFYFFQKGLGAV